MKKKNKTMSAKRKEPTSRLRTYSIIVACGMLIVTGFFFAARQHFSAMDYGMKNSRLRRQVDDLEAEKRRLMLAREISLSPIEILKAAKRAGLGGSETSTYDIAQVFSTTKQKAKPPVASASTTASSPMQAVKATAVAPAPRIVPATDAKPERERVVKQDKRSVPAE